MSDEASATPPAEQKAKRTREEYESVESGISPRWWKDVDEKATEILDNGLMMFGDPKEYRHHRALSNAAVEGTLLWALVEGYVVLPDEYIITDEESFEREANEAAARVSRENQLEQLRDVIGGQGAGPYL